MAAASTEVSDAKAKQYHRTSQAGNSINSRSGFYLKAAAATTTAESAGANAKANKYKLLRNKPGHDNHRFPFWFLLAAATTATGQLFCQYGNV